MTTTTDFAPVHPGEILNTEFLEPLGISQYRIAKAIDVPPRRINEIVHGKRAITADTALRLARALGVGDMFFVNMQARYDTELARDQLAAKLGAIHPLIPVVADGLALPPPKGKRTQTVSDPETRKPNRRGMTAKKSAAPSERKRSAITTIRSGDGVVRHVKGGKAVRNAKKG